MELIKEHFPNLTALQIEQFDKLQVLYEHWNEQINVISRKDMENFYEHHVLHSLGIAKVIKFKPGTEILDVGTGGGFPGIPLAILFPESNFHLIDARNKKIKVVNDVIDQLGLKNVYAEHIRAEELKKQYDFIVSRAVTRMDRFYDWVRGRIKKKQQNGLPNGILYLKGGDLKEEMKPIQTFNDSFDLTDYFKSPFFETKKVVYVQVY
jgi:16S rRNA (guanine527-N7)-methyltransferase